MQEGAEKFREIREAFETLGDEAKRGRNDEELARQGSEVRITRVPEIIESRRSQFDEIDRFFSRTDEFFEGFLPGFFEIERGRIRAKDLYFEAFLSPPRQAAEGVLFPVTVPVVEPCPRCRKAGLWEGFFCPVCFEHGRVQSEREFSLSVPPNVKNGTEIRLSLEDIGLRNVYLNVRVRIDQIGRAQV